MEYYMEQLLKELQEIRDDIRHLNSGLYDITSRFNMYIKQESRIQENSNTELVYEYLREHVPTTVTRSTIKEFYNFDGSIVTDFDGCILLGSYLNTYVSNYRNVTFKNNRRQINPAFEYKKAVIIESKHSLTKAKVDKKLIQLYTIISIMKKYKSTPIKEMSLKFRESIESLTTFTDDIYMVFASDDIPYEVKEYILLINNGMTNEQYEEIVFKLLKKEQAYLSLLKDKTIKPFFKKQLQSLKTLSEFKSMLEQKELEGYYRDLIQFTIPYSNVQPLFTFVKGRLGIASMNKVQLPTLFQ